MKIFEEYPYEISNREELEPGMEFIQRFGTGVNDRWEKGVAITYEEYLEANRLTSNIDAKEGITAKWENYGTSWNWWRPDQYPVRVKFRELQYDPNQQGDEEDDI